MNDQTPNAETPNAIAPEDRAKLLSAYRQAQRALVAAQTELLLFPAKLRDASTPDANVQQARDALFAARAAYYTARNAYHALPLEPEPDPAPQAAEPVPMDAEPEPLVVRTLMRLDVQAAD